MFWILFYILIYRYYWNYFCTLLQSFKFLVLLSMLYIGFNIWSYLELFCVCCSCYHQGSVHSQVVPATRHHPRAKHRFHLLWSHKIFPPRHKVVLPLLRLNPKRLRLNSPVTIRRYWTIQGYNRTRDLRIPWIRCILPRTRRRDMCRLAVIRPHFIRLW